MLNKIYAKASDHCSPDRASGFRNGARCHEGHKSLKTWYGRSIRFLKGAQIVILVGDPTKAETIVQRVKFPPNFKVPPHTHPYSEVVTVLSATYWNAMGDDMEKGVMLKPGSFFVLPANHTHRVWTADEEVIIQVTFTGPGGITFINPDDDPRKKAQ